MVQPGRTQSILAFIRVIYYLSGDANFNFEIHSAVDTEKDTGPINKMTLDKSTRRDWTTQQDHSITPDWTIQQNHTGPFNKTILDYSTRPHWTIQQDDNGPFNKTILEHTTRRYWTNQQVNTGPFKKTILDHSARRYLTFQQNDTWPFNKTLTRFRIQILNPQRSTAHRDPLYNAVCKNARLRMQHFSPMLANIRNTVFIFEQGFPSLKAGQQSSSWYENVSRSILGYES